MPATLAPALIDSYQDWIRRDPVAHARECLGIDLWEKQQEIAIAVQNPNNHQISIRSGNGVGKTLLCAVLVIQYLDTHCPGYCLATGASWGSVRKTLWADLLSTLRQAPMDYGGERLETEWKRGGKWGAFCLSPTDPENFGGYRTKTGAGIVCDEASALIQKVLEAMQGVCSAEGSLLVLSGNPLRPSGPFFDSFYSSEWINFHISTYDVLELGIPGLATHKWVDSIVKEYGENSHVVRTRIEGAFPTGDVDSIIELGWFTFTPKPLKQLGELFMGVDVARYGDDRTVILIRDKRSIQSMFTYAKKDTMQTVGLIQRAAKKFNVEAHNIFVDDGGLGGGVTDRLHELDFVITPVNFGKKARKHQRFANVRAEMYWAIRDAVKPVEKSTPKFFIAKEFEDVAKECTWPTYKMRSDSRILLESKDAIKARTGHSPDLADALALSFYGSIHEYSVGA